MNPSYPPTTGDRAMPPRQVSTFEPRRSSSVVNPFKSLKRASSFPPAGEHTFHRRFPEDRGAAVGDVRLPVDPAPIRFPAFALRRRALEPRVRSSQQTPERAMTDDQIMDRVEMYAWMRCYAGEPDPIPLNPQMVDIRAHEANRFWEEAREWAGTIAGQRPSLRERIRRRLGRDVEHVPECHRE